MRITEIKSSSSTRKIKKNTPGIDGDFENMMSGEVADNAQPSAIAGVGALTSLNGLLNIQEVNLEEEINSKQFKHGQILLDYLNELRHEMLSGGVSAAAVQKLLEEARSNNNSYEYDPQLKTVINEIQLRAEVELAKIQMNQTEI